MKANPGGLISPDNVIGRDRFIRSVWRTLEQQGVLMVAERRMGKSTIVNKMVAEPQPGTVVLPSDLEAIGTPLEFVERVLSDIADHLGTAIKTTGWIQKIRTALGGVEIGGVLKLPAAAAPDWKICLDRVLGDLADNHRDQRVILIWDELPWMLQKMARDRGEPMVIELLDMLRSQRQRRNNLRMVYTGSIGLHHVISGLTDGGYATPGVNDLRTVELPPLDEGDAIILAGALLEGERLETGDRGAIARQIANQVDCVPYYIHQVIASLADRGARVTADAVDATVLRGLDDPQQPWHLEHYLRRLTSYYGARAGLARAILDLLAEGGPLALSLVHEHLQADFQPENDVSSRIVNGDGTALRDLVHLMQRDHYLERDGRGAWGFRFGLIRRWWRLRLGLV